MQTVGWLLAQSTSLTDLAGVTTYANTTGEPYGWFGGADDGSTIKAAIEFRRREDPGDPGEPEPDPDE